MSDPKDSSGNDASGTPPGMGEFLGEPAGLDEFLASPSQDPQAARAGEGLKTLTGDPTGGVQLAGQAIQHVVEAPAKQAATYSQAIEADKAGNPQPLKDWASGAGINLAVGTIGSVKKVPGGGVQSPGQGWSISQLKKMKEMGWHNPDTGLEISAEEGERLLQQLQQSAADRGTTQATRQMMKPAAPKPPGEIGFGDAPLEPKALERGTEAYQKQIDSVKQKFTTLYNKSPESYQAFKEASLASPDAASLSYDIPKSDFLKILEEVEGKAAAKGSDKIRAQADEYMKAKGLNPSVEAAAVKADPARGAKIAQEYEQMRHNPSDPRVKASYDALIKETVDQFQTIKKSGLKIEKITPEMGNPYPKGSADVAKDIHENNHLYYYPTEAGFGSSGKQAADHPLLADTGESIGGETLKANDMFRIVHDYFGHAKEGNQFGPSGEETAWRIHAPMYTPLARKAMTTETRGQNSWVNFGPKGEANRANPGATTYADQKAGLLPDWVLREGSGMAPTQKELALQAQKKGTAAYKQAVAKGKKEFAVGGEVQHFEDGGQAMPADYLSAAPAAPEDNAPPPGLDEFIAPEMQQEQYGTPGQQAIAGVEGLAKGLFGPAATAAESVLGVSPEAQLGRQEANPFTHYGAEAAGLIGPAVATLGASLGVKAGMTGAAGAYDALKAAEAFTQAGQLTKAGEAASVAMGLGAEGASTISKIGSVAVKGAVENALFQAGDEVSHAILNDPNQSIGTAAIDVGLASLIGGAFGAGVGSVEPLWNAAMGTRAGGVLKAIHKHLGGAEDVVPDYVNDLINRIGVDMPPEVRASLSGDSEIQQMAKTLEQSDTSTSGLKYQETLNKFKQQVADSTITTLGRTPKQVEALGDLSKYEYGKRIADRLAKEYDAKISPVIKEFDALREKYGDTELKDDWRLPGVNTDRFSVLTSDNPGGKKLSKGANANRFAEFQDELNNAGISYIKTTGNFAGLDENSILIPHGPKMDEHAVNAIGKRWGQEAVAHKIGPDNRLTYTSGPKEGSFHPGTGMTVDPKIEENYTQIGGKRFQLNFDFDRTFQSELVHYSNNAQPFNTVDPAFHGSGVSGAEGARYGRIPRSYYYEDAAMPENFVTGQAKNVYTVNRPQKILDFNSSEAQPIIEAVNKKSAELNLDQAEATSLLEFLTRDAGYDGFKNTAGDVPGAVALFHPQQPIKAGPVDAFHHEALRAKEAGLVPKPLTSDTTGAIADRIMSLAAEQGWAASPSSKIMTEINRILKELPAVKTVRDLNNYITAIGDNMQSDPLNKPLIRAGSLIKAILKDAEADVVGTRLGREEGAEALSRYKAARNEYRLQSEIKEALDSRLHARGSTAGYGKSLREMGQTDGEAVLRRLSGSNDADLLQVLSKQFPGTAKLLKQYHIDALLKSATSSAKVGEAINAGRLVSNLEKMSPELRAFAINKKQLDKLQAVGSLLDEFNKLPHNFSNTARTMDKLIQYLPGSAIAAAGMLAGHNPAAAAVVGMLVKTLSKDVPDATRLGLLKFLGSPKAVNAEGFKAMVDVLNHSIKGEKMLTRGIRAIFRPGTEVMPAAAFASDSDRNKLDKHLKQLQVNQAPLMNVGGKSNYYLADHAASMSQVAATAVNYLNALRPKTQPQNPLDTPIKVTAAQKSEFDRALSIAQQPLTVLDKINKGTITPQDIKHIQTIYPNLYMDMSKKLNIEMIEAVHKGMTIPYKTRLGLSMFLAQPLDATMTPQGITAAQPMPPAQPQQQGGGGAPKGNTAAIGKMNDMYRTKGQHEEYNKAGR